MTNTALIAALKILDFEILQSNKYFHKFKLCEYYIYEIQIYNDKPYIKIGSPNKLKVLTTNDKVLNMIIDKRNKLEYKMIDWLR